MAYDFLMVVMHCRLSMCQQQMLKRLRLILVCNLMLTRLRLIRMKFLQNNQILSNLLSFKINITTAHAVMHKL